MDAARLLSVSVILVMALPALLPWLFVFVRGIRGWRARYEGQAHPNRFKLWTVLAILLAIPMLLYIAAVALEIYMGLTCEGADCAGVGMLTFIVSWPAYFAALASCLLYWFIFRRKAAASA